MACQWTRHFGAMGGVIWLGIDASEVLAVMQVLRIKRKRWPRVFAGVKVMQTEIRGDLNEKEAER